MEESSYVDADVDVKKNAVCSYPIPRRSQLMKRRDFLKAPAAGMLLAPGFSFAEGSPERNSARASELRPANG